MLRILGFVLAAILSLLALVIVVGYALPTGHVAARAILLPVPPDAVFALISDFANEPAWRSDVTSVEILPMQDGHIRFREISKNARLILAATEVSPPQRMVTRIADPKLPFGGSWIFTISPTANGCRLNITERGEIYNPIFRFAERFILGYNATLDSYLKSAGRKFGSNSVPQDGEQQQ
jgi:hypothetical protein